MFLLGTADTMHRTWTGHAGHGARWNPTKSVQDSYICKVINTHDMQRERENPRNWTYHMTTRQVSL